MIGRRSFLFSIASLSLTQLLAGCSNALPSLKITLLQGSIPPQLIGDFRKTISNKQQVKFQPQTQLSEIFRLLNNPSLAESSSNFVTNLWRTFGQKPPKEPDLFTLGDYWLESAINQKLLQPLDPNKFKNWNNLPLLWQQLVRRDKTGKPSRDGKIYGVPYRWGNTIIVYRKDKLQSLGLTPQDWDILWSKQLRDRISLLDNYREVIGLTLKFLGHSYNSKNLSSINNLENKLIELNQQVKLYSSDKYLQPLILGDIWLAVGWSSEILPLIKRYSNLEIVVPKSGTSLWADIWIKPQSISDNKINSDLSTAWIDFCLQEKAAKQISLFTNAISPIWTPEKPINLTKNSQNGAYIQATLANLAQSELIMPLDSKNNQQYLSLWQKIRQTPYPQESRELGG